MKKNLFRIAIAVVGIVGAFFLFGFILNASLDTSEVFECNKWNDEATYLIGYYVTPWQVAQCNAHGITLNAPVE